jgi:hypothetical protein
MKKHKTGTILIVIGICFVAFYLVVRLVFIQDINAALAQAQVRSLGDAVRANVSGYLILISFGVTLSSWVCCLL